MLCGDRRHRIVRTKMKKSATQARKQTLDLDPVDHIAARAVDKSATMKPDNDQDLAQLVWKYFGEEISEALREVQEGLAPERTGSIQQISHRKR